MGVDGNNLNIGVDGNNSNTGVDGNDLNTSVDGNNLNTVVDGYNLKRNIGNKISYYRPARGFINDNPVFTLMVPIDTNQQQMIRGELTESSTSIHKEMTLLTPKLLATRKMILHWCLNTYAKGIIKNKSKSSSQPKTKKRDSKSIYLVGAGTPDFSSSFDGKSSSCKISYVRLMTNLRCLLFLAKSDSEELLTFLMPSCSTQVISSGQLCHDLQRRVRICSEYGVNIDNETLWIILKSTMSVECAIDSSTTLSLIEQLMYHCRNGQTAEILIDDSKILWEMYKLVEYFPVATSEQKLYKSNDCSDVGEGDDSCKENNTKERITRENIPR